MYGGRVQYAIARAVYGQIRYAQGKPGGVPADIIGLGRHLSEIEGFYRALILKPSLQILTGEGVGGKTALDYQKTP